MDRMELLLALGEVPELGSPEDFTLRRFVGLNRLRRVAKAKLDAVGNIRADNEADVKRYLKEYINLEFRLDDLNADRDLKLREEYEALKDAKVQVFVDRDGVLTMSGL